MTNIKNIRNFAIIAHIDHGKSTLADRLIQACQGLSDREMKAQVLDSMDLEREKGITIKAQSVRLVYESKGETYILNMIDTPGHVDFAYEVSRSLYSCDGSLLIVDATQGVEAQTIANIYTAIDANHEIITVLNKIDLPAADPESVKEQIGTIIGLDTTNSMNVSAKTGEGVDKLLDHIVEFIPPPKEPETDKLKALLVDSWYDNYIGVIILVRIYSGTMKAGDKIVTMSNSKEYTVENVGYFLPKKTNTDCLYPGEIGYITCGLKNLESTVVGDTITMLKSPIKEPIAGFKKNPPVVFCGIFPADASEYPDLKAGLEKLYINDNSFTFETESSPAIGFGFRCGFLGLLHLEIIQERIQREFNIDIITTAPSVMYNVHLFNGDIKSIHNPADMPEVSQIKSIEEPWVKAYIMVQEEFLGATLELCSKRRGKQTNVEWAGKRAMLTYELPLNEIAIDFYDELKSISKGYASFDYEISHYEEGNLVTVAIMVNNEDVDALSFITHRTNSATKGREICNKLKDLIPRQMFQIPIQAAIGGKIIARENVTAFRKDVTAKCYGGDVSRKRKLLEKQKAGKKKMRQFGKVNIPHNAFIEALKASKNK